MASQEQEIRYPDYPLFKGLQKPLEFPLVLRLSSLNSEKDCTPRKTTKVFLFMPILNGFSAALNRAIKQA